MVPKVVGCNLLDQVQAGSRTVCDAKILGLRVAQVTTSIEKRKRVPKTHVFLLLHVAVKSREWQGRHCSGTVGHEEGIRSCGSSSGLQGNETARCEFVLDGMIAALWNGSVHESVLVNEKQRGTSPESPVIFTMIMEMAQLGSHENCVEAGRFYIGCDLFCGRCGVCCCVSCCCGRGGDKGYCKVGEEEVGLTVGAQKTLWTSYLKMVDKSIMLD